MPCVTIPWEAPSESPGPPGRAELEGALESSSYHTILLLPGRYLLTEMLDIARDVTLRATVAGEAVLDGQNTSRVVYISSGTIVLNGLNITRGFIDHVCCPALMNGVV